MKCKLCHSTKIVVKFNLDQFQVMTCKSCGLVFLNNLWPQEEIADVYDAGYYQERKEYYFGNVIAAPQSGRWNENLDDFLGGLKTLGRFFHKPGKLLDIGCGIGIFLNMAREYGWEVTGVEVSPFAAEYARKRFNLEVHRGGLRKSNFPSNTFDVVTLWDTFEHMADPFAELREIKRVLKTGGVLLLDTPNADGLLRAAADVLFRVTAGQCHYPVRKLYHKYHLYYFGAANLSRALHEAGFTILEFKKKFIPRIKARGSMAEKAIVAVFSVAEKMLRKEYELLFFARKDPE